MKTKFWSIVMAGIISAVLLAGCSSNSSGYSAPNTTTTIASNSSTSAANQTAVTISGFAFSPQTLTVAKGATVAWTNNDSTTHTVTSDTGVWDSGNLAQGKAFSYTFSQTGTFQYHCKIHSSMTAKIVVQ
jgi:plastocyanin